MIPNLIPRSAWEESGWTVAQHTNSGPHPYGRTLNLIVHYTGGSSIPEDFTGVFGFIRSTQRDYVRNRGYSIGYNWCVDRAGRIWELRGDAFKCAANGSSITNDDPAVLCLVSGANPANDEMTTAVRTVVTHVAHQANREVGVLGHRDVNSTACPGDGLYAQVLNGTFRTTTPPPEDPPMRYMLRPPAARPGGPWFLRWDGSWSYLTGRDRDLLAAEGVKTFDDLVERYDLVHRQVFGPVPIS